MKKKILVSMCVILTLIINMVTVSAVGLTETETNTNTIDISYKEEFSNITDSVDLENTVVASGVVHQEDGITPASNATLLLYAWPSSDALEKFNLGDSFSRTPIGKTVSDKNGYYELRIDPKIDIENSWTKNGILDCEIGTITDSGLMATSFSILKSEKIDIKNQNSSDIKVTALADNATGDVFSGLNIDVTVMPKSDFSTTNSISPKGAMLLGTYDPVWVTVGTILLNLYGVTEQFTYSSGSTSTLGVGVSASGQYGTFTASGTMSKSSTATITFPLYQNTGYKYMETQYKYALYYCAIGTYYYYEVRPYQFTGGTRTTLTATMPSSGYYSWYTRGSTFTKDTTTATTISAGAKMAGEIGINLSAQCGYTNSAKIVYNFVSGSGYIYGKYNYPANACGLVWARS